MTEITPEIELEVNQIVADFISENYFPVLTPLAWLPDWLSLAWVKFFALALVFYLLYLSNKRSY